MNTISFMSANFVARQVGYHMTEGWMQGQNATEEFFKPVETFAARFETYVADARAMGFEAFDLWLGILHPAWATDTHIRAANTILTRYRMPVTSLAGGFGDTREEFEAMCRFARAMHTRILAGRTSLLDSDRGFVVDRLTQYGLRLGIENHPEKTPGELLAQIGDGGGGCIGAAVDTGWFGTQDYNAADAIAALQDHLVYIHLKDVLAPGGHETCRFGKGCVPVRACVEVLKKINYAGGICVEHEPELYDPTDDCRASLILLKEWLS